MIRSFEVYAAQSCADITQADLLAGTVQWLTVLTEMAGEEGLFRQVPHLRVEGEGAAGLERRYSVFFKENAILVRREALTDWKPSPAIRRVLDSLPRTDARDLSEHLRSSVERLTIPVEAQHVDQFEWRLGLAIAATFAEARNGLIVSDDGWFAVTDDARIVRLDG